MPKSKRSKVVSLTKTEKKGREKKEALVQQIQENVDKWRYLWLFQVGSMRNAHLKDIRADWKETGRLFYGRVSVMALALGRSPEQEYKAGLSEISSHLRGQLGLFFTSWDPQETLDYFHSFQKPEFARSGTIAPQNVVLEAGPLTPIVSPEDAANGIQASPFPPSMEPQFRKLGLSTRLEKGVITLAASQTVCKKGGTLTTEQAQILKLLGLKLSIFRVALRWMWDKETGEVKEHDGSIGEEVGSGSDNGNESDEEDDVIGE